MEARAVLKGNEPDTTGLTDTKQSEEISTFNRGEGNYNVWKRNRKYKQGGGLMIIVKRNITVDNPGRRGYVWRRSGGNLESEIQRQR